MRFSSSGFFPKSKVPRPQINTPNIFEIVEIVKINCELLIVNIKINIIFLIFFRCVLVCICCDFRLIAGYCYPEIDRFLGYDTWLLVNFCVL